MINKSISVVVPCYNEAGNILNMYGRLTAVLAPLVPEYEIIFVENGSSDNSYDLMIDLAKKDNRVVVIKLSRNFQSQAAYTAGMEYATGNAVVCLDGDIQDPPELISKFVGKWMEGYDIVYGVREKRKGSLFRRICYKIFYRIFKKIAYIDIPVDAGDFSLISRKVVNHMNALPETDRFLRGLRAWVGFKHTGIPYTRDERTSGRTTNSFFDNIGWAKKGIYSFSYAPLEFLSNLALLMFFASLLLIVLQVVTYFLIPGIPHGITTIIVLLLFFSSLQMLFLSFLGEYVSRIFNEVKGRPKFIVSEVINSRNKKFKDRYVEEYDSTPL